MTNLAIIIVSWNVKALLIDCLRSVEADLADSRLSAQIWVVDNASTDDTVATLRRDFPNVQLIASKTNLGFAAGNNAALRQLGFGDAQTQPASLPDAVLLLNPDTVVHRGALQTLFESLQSTPNAGIAGAKLLYGDGSFQHSAFAFPGLWQLIIELLPVPGRWVESGLNGRYAKQLYDGDEPFQIDHPLGAAMAVKREAIQQVGLLDERYHMYIEEIDWSRRIASAGWLAYCVPAAVITHVGGQSTDQIKMSSFINLWTSRYQFYQKHYHPLKLWLAQQIVRLGLNRRIRQAQQNAKQGKLSAAELAEQLAGYRRVIQIWQGRSS